ncbi:MAG: helix-turn-helix domain-containing protein [Chloroflexota bacterium]
MTRIYTDPDKRLRSRADETPSVDDRRAALTIRALRVRRHWRQKDLAARAGVSRQLVTKIESARFESVSLRAVRMVVAALGGSAEVLIRAPGGDADRTLNAGHAAMHEAAARLFRQLNGWVTAPEVTFSIYGERGVIDILAWHAASRTLLVVELKTLLVDINDLMGSMDRRRRLATRMARERGWFAIQVSVWVAVADTSTNHRRLQDHASVLRTAFPDDGRTLRRWLPQPRGSVAVLSFLSAATSGGAKHDFRPIRQVRKRAAGRSTHDESRQGEPGSPKQHHRP